MHLPGVRSAAALSEAAPRRLQRALFQHKVREDLLAPPVTAALKPEDELSCRLARRRQQRRLADGTSAVTKVHTLLWPVSSTVLRLVLGQQVAGNRVELLCVNCIFMALIEIGRQEDVVSRMHAPLFFV